MAFIEVKNLSFVYHACDDYALSDISFSADKGDFIVICGHSGCGKTTLLRHFKPDISPYGLLSGSIFIDRQELTDENSSNIGFVMQDPDSQIVTDKVWHELAFGLENLGIESQTIRRKTAEIASFFGIQEWYHMSTSELSGGQKQLLNLASVMVMQPDILILDEPTSRLDPIAAADFLSAVAKLNRELGTTIIMTEHRLDDVLPMCSKSIAMEQGRISFCGNPYEMGMKLRDCGSKLFLSMPVPMRIWSSVEPFGDCPITISDGKAWLGNFASGHQIAPLSARTARFAGNMTLEIKDAYFKYGKNSNDIIKGLNLSAYAGQLLAIIGGNGAGKTTLLSLLCGINKPYRGKAKLHGRVALLPQDPKALFLHSSVYDELIESSGKQESVMNIAELCSVSHLLKRHPYDLSGGEQQKAALAKILLADPDILLMDEPTKGLDNEFKSFFGRIINELLLRGKTIIMVSHDIDFCAEYADNISMLFDGEIVSSGTPTEFFSRSSFYTTCASRMARAVCAEAVTVGDVIEICGGSDNPANTNHFRNDAQADDLQSATKKDTHIIPESKQKKSGISEPRTSGGWSAPVKNGRSHITQLITAIILLFAVPLTAYFGLKYIGIRKYFIVSTIIIFECMLPFVLSFENRRPRARELITIAVMCAIGIAGRAAFSMFPQFKPVLAIVIISGAALGSECGALIGALIMFISNMLFFQGSWTPWQMFACGLIGFLSGAIFYPDKIKGKIPLCVFGALSAVVIYGGIMNPAAVIIYQENISLSMLLASFVTGFPLDIVHAAATVLFLWILSQPITEKINRIKLKYGLIFA